MKKSALKLTSLLVLCTAMFFAGCGRGCFTEKSRAKWENKPFRAQLNNDTATKKVAVRIYKVIKIDSSQYRYLLTVRRMNEFSKVLWLCDSLPAIGSSIKVPVLKPFRKLSLTN